MDYDNIIERRKVKKGQHKMILELSSEEYRRTYDSYSNDVAQEIVNTYLNNRGDDGRPSNIRMEKTDEGNIIKIHADLNYLGNDHSTYGGIH